MSENEPVKNEAAAPMDVELKDIVDLLWDGVNVAEDVAQKAYLSLPGALAKMLADAPGAMENINDLQAEITALPGADQEADMKAYIEQKFSSEPAKTQLILAATLLAAQTAVTLAQNLLALKAAIQS